MYRESLDKVMDNREVNEDEIVNLIIDYIGNYDKQEHPFLLFNLANVHENDHTEVLLGLLKYNNHQFLNSFLQMIGAPECDDVKEKLTDQKQAIGKTGKGFIDLYFEYSTKGGTTEKVIIENKIYGAGDTDYQLARYIATALDSNISNEKFENEYWKQWKEVGGANTFSEEDFNHIHVVYLTSDGEKEPKENSLPQFFRKDSGNDDWEAQYINYYPINYIEHIIPWLENDVLPNMPYSDDGIAIAGVRQYIISLKVLYSSKGDSQVVKGWSGNIKGFDKEKYETIMEMWNNVKLLITQKDVRGKKKWKNNVIQELKDKGLDVNDLPELRSLARDLRTAATDIFASDASDLGGDWKLYFTPSYIFLYRQKWADLDTRKYSIPSIYLLTATSNFLKKNIDWRMQVDHLNPTNSQKLKIEKFMLSNHDKTAYYAIQNIKKFEYEINEVKSRRDYYKSLIEQLEKYIQIVDAAVEEVKQNPGDRIFQETILEILAKEFKE